MLLPIFMNEGILLDHHFDCVWSTWNSSFDLALFGLFKNLTASHQRDWHMSGFQLCQQDWSIFNHKRWPNVQTATDFNGNSSNSWQKPDWLEPIQALQLSAFPRSAALKTWEIYGWHRHFRSWSAAGLKKFTIDPLQHKSGQILKKRQKRVFNILFY